MMTFAVPRREAKEALEKRLIETQDPKNPIVMMMDSGPW